MAPPGHLRKTTMLKQRIKIMKAPNKKKLKRIMKAPNKENHEGSKQKEVKENHEKSNDLEISIPRDRLEPQAWPRLKYFK